VITEEDVLSAPMIAYPFGLYDCCPVTDGAAAAIITTPQIAKNMAPDRYVKVLGVGVAVTSMRPQMRSDFDWIGWPATTFAAKEAYKMAGIENPKKEVSFAEVHDCFTWTEISNYEDLGFCEKGEGWKLIMDGVTTLEGELPVNPDGGLKSFGHPIGASGLRMIYEVVKQLRGECDKRQVKDPKIGLAHNIGGPGAIGSVTIFAGA
jgi:acetyl-CoA C-acetyltransferase